MASRLLMSRLTVTMYTHDPHTFETLMLMLFIGWNLLLLFDLED